jgi:metal-dependent HD superfamily phosphatase/phosphodiesterase
MSTKKPRRTASRPPSDKPDVQQVPARIEDIPEAASRDGSDNASPITPEERRRAKKRLVTQRGYRKSKREIELDEELRAAAASTGDEKLLRVVDLLLGEKLLGVIQNYANIVSIQRLGYNDHGPVHARIVTLNALRIFDLLVAGGVQPSIVQEEVATHEDARIAVVLAAFLHDLGMSVCRDDHETHALFIADPFLLRILGEVYSDPGTVYMLRSLVAEGIVGHMAHYKVHSVEAGIIMVADGADCTAGRSFVPNLIPRNPMIGDIHRFSATAIHKVDIRPGVRRPVRIDVTMTSSAGLFQVEEVLMGKAKASPIFNHLEIAAHLDGVERLYLG